RRNTKETQNRKIEDLYIRPWYFFEFRSSPDISPDRPRMAVKMRTDHRIRALILQDNLASGLRGFRPVRGGHLGHARLAHRTLYGLHRSSPTCLARNNPEFRVLMKYPG
ncbi:MAG: hypothetical protein ABL878_14285, partial [Burkholderiales bacterium]